MEQALQSQSPSWAQPMVSKADCCQRRQPLLRPSRAGSRHRGVSRFTPSPWPRNRAAGTDVLALPPGCPVPSLWTPAPRSKSRFLRWGFISLSVSSLPPLPPRQQRPPANAAANASDVSPARSRCYSLPSRELWPLRRATQLRQRDGGPT